MKNRHVKKFPYGLGEHELQAVSTIVIMLATMIGFFVGFLTHYESFYMTETTALVMWYAIAWGLLGAACGYSMLSWVSNIYHDRLLNPEDFPVDPGGGRRPNVLAFPTVSTQNSFKKAA